MSRSAYLKIEEGLLEAVAVARGEAEAFRVHHPITSERREAAGKIGDDNAPQEKGSEVDPRRMPSV